MWQLHSGVAPEWRLQLYLLLSPAMVITMMILPVGLGPHYHYLVTGRRSDQSSAKWQPAAAAPGLR